ncbi:hypothetical protein B484DRAFT_331293 [Ochromonadaceae sp. CCMP2298]|nr:hypothetical protein B484DRAFT_331293 [Ochromonadaceae sp. CCMP2298]
MQLLKRELLRVVPICLVIGSSMELFMIKTGFYDIVTRKEGERRAERVALDQQRVERMKKLNVKFEMPEEK